MKIVSLRSIINTERDVDWGNGTSRRLVVASDNMGYSIHYTTTLAGTSSKLKYDNHLESCFVISGYGTIESYGKVYSLSPGDVYMLDNHDEHIISANNSEDLITLCVFNPPCIGTENHNLNDDTPSGY